MSSVVSPGPSTSELLPVVICDLDSTVLSVNSFRPWVRYLIFGHFGDMPIAERLEIAITTIIVMAERKLMNKDHAVTKGKLQKLWRRAIAKDPAGLAQEWLLSDLAATVRPNLSALLSRAAADTKQHVLLATAAAGEYAEPLAAKIGFRHILATPLLEGVDAAKQHNVGSVKRDRTVAFLQEKGWDKLPRVFLTDHIEDLPLIEVCDKILWFGNETQLQLAQTKAPGKLFVPALTLENKEVLAEISTAAAVVHTDPAPKPAEAAAVA